MRDGCGCDHGVPWFNEVVLWFRCCFSSHFRIFRIPSSHSIRIASLTLPNNSLLTSPRLKDHIPYRTFRRKGLPLTLQTRNKSLLSRRLHPASWHHARTTTLARELNNSYARLRTRSHNQPRTISPHQSTETQEPAQLPPSRTNTPVSHIDRTQHHDSLCSHYEGSVLLPPAS